MRMYVYLTVLVMVILVSCREDKTQMNRIESIKVKTREAKAAPVAKQYTYSGTVQAKSQSTLSTRIMGQVEKILVNEGDKVTKGALLVKIRSNDLRAKQQQIEAGIAEANAVLVLAKKDLERIIMLHARKSATDKELDDMRMHYKMAEARSKAADNMREELNETLVYANIRAPYDGVVTTKFVNEGDMANPGMPIIAIEKENSYEAVVRIPESELNLWESGDEVYLELASAGVQTKGIMREINPSSKFSGPQYQAKIDIVADENVLKQIYSGMFAEVILSKGTEKRILVPADHLIERGQLTGLWTVSSNKTAMLRWVRLGKKYNNGIEILSGLQEGEQFIISKETPLFDGAKLEIIN